MMNFVASNILTYTNYGGDPMVQKCMNWTYTLRYDF